MATQIGVVKALIGEVTATAADGTIRTLQVGDTVYANELISTGNGGAVEIEFADGSVMDLGRDSQAMLDSNMFDPNTSTFAEAANEDVPDDIAAIQQAILEGEDPTEAGEATAAGAGVEGGNEGHEAVFVNYLNPEVTPDAGFDTVGVNNTIDDYVDEQLILNDGLPTAGMITVLLDEDDLGDTDSEEAAVAVSNLIAGIQAEFQGDTGFFLQSGFHQGVGDEANGDDVQSPNPTFFSGALNANYGLNGPGSITFNPVVSQPTGLTSGGEPIQIWVSDDGLTLIGYIAASGDDFPGQSTGSPDFSGAEIIFSAQIDPDTLNFTAGIYGPLDHPDTAEEGTFEENLLINMAFTITDSDGDAAQGIVQLNVDDDAPTVDGNRVVKLDDDVFDGNEGGPKDGPDSRNTEGTLSHSFGADGGSISWQASGAPKGFSYEADGDNLLVKQDGETVLTLTLNPDTGDYTVTQNAPVKHKDNNKDNENNQVFKVGYLVTDSDGDTVKGQLKITVDDDTPTIDKASQLSVQETDVDNDGFDVIDASGQLSHINEGADGASVTGMSLQASADFNSLRVGGEEVVATQVGNVITVNTVGGEPVFELTYQPDGSYTYKQFQAFDHQNDNPNRDNSEVIKLGFSFTVTDGDGDSATGSLIVTVKDGDPVAFDDTDTVVDGTATGNVITDASPGDDGDTDDGADAIGPDGAEVSSVSFGAVSGTQSPDGSITVQGDYGTLTIQSDGAYVYTYNEQQGSPELVEMTAYRLGESFLTEDGTFTTDGATGTVTNGHGVAGTSGTNNAVPNQLNYSGSLSEALAFGFGGQNVTSATVQISRMFQNENGGEAARWHAFDADGNQVASGILSKNTEGPYTNTTDAAWSNVHSATFTISDIGLFHTVVVEAIPYSLNGSSASDDSDFFVDITGYQVSPTDTGDYEDVFTYELTDGDGDKDTATLSISGDAVTGEAQATIAPVAVDNDESVSEESTITGNIITDDNDGAGAATGRDWDADTPVLNLSLAGIESVSDDAIVNQVDGATVITTQYGTLTIYSDGSYSYTADGIATAELADGDTANDVFSYTIIDPNGNQSGSANLTITVTGTNETPVIEVAASAGGDEDSPGIEVVLTATDSDGTIENFVLNSLPENGTLFVGSTEATVGMSVPASGGSATVTFVPDADWSDNNGDAPVTFDYIAVDNEGAESDPATATISVDPVTDTPAVSISLTANEVTELYAADLSNVLDDAEGVVGYPAGFTVTALKAVGDSWVETDISVKDSGSPTGFGVAGNGGSNGANDELESGEKLFIELDSPASSVTFQLAWLNSSNETAVYTLTYDDGSTQTFQINGGSDRVDPPVTIDAPNGKTITAIEFSTPTTGNRVTTSDYLVHSVSYAAAFMTYSVDIAAMPTDTDGSESITQLLVKTPEGVTLSDSQFVETVDGESSWLLLLDELVNDDNDYTGPTVNVAANGEVTVTGLTLTVPTDFDGDLVVSAEATAYDPDAAIAQATAITGDDTANELVGTDGDDILIGGGGNDILTGGDGADIFVWNAGDEGGIRPALDTITDFSAAEGDSLDLADILQGEETGNIADYISVTQSGSDVVIEVTPEGAGGHMNQVIKLENTTVNDLAGTDTSGMSQADIINTLISNGQLNVDQS